MRHVLVVCQLCIEYAMNALQQVFERLNDDLSKDFDQTKSVLEEARTNHCSSHTKKQLASKGECSVTIS
jgi:hypothetical protein